MWVHATIFAAAAPCYPRSGGLCAVMSLTVVRPSTATATSPHGHQIMRPHSQGEDLRDHRVASSEVAEPALLPVSRTCLQQQPPMAVCVGMSCPACLQRRRRGDGGDTPKRRLPAFPAWTHKRFSSGCASVHVRSSGGARMTLAGASRLLARAVTDRKGLLHL